MIIRRIEEKDVMQSAQCAADAFGGFVTDEDLVFPGLPMLCAFDDDNTALMAQLETYDRYCNFNNDFLHCLNIEGVASSPKYRGKGAVRALFEYIYSHTEEFPYDISVLSPCSVEFYRKFGFEPVGIRYTAEIPFTAVKNYGDYCTFNKCTENDFKEVNRIRNSLLKNYNLSFTCDKLNNVLNKDEFSTYICKQNGTPTGIFTYSLQDDKSAVKIHEILFDNLITMYEILSYIKENYNHYTVIAFENISEFSPLVDYIANIKGSILNASHSDAVRVLDFKKVFSKKKWPDNYGKFTFKIDDLISANSGTFLCEYADGKASVSEFAGIPDFIFEPCGMSKVFVCGTKPEKINYIDGVTVNNMNMDFFAAFPECC